MKNILQRGVSERLLKLLAATRTLKSHHGVVKRYLEQTVSDIHELGQTVEQQTKKGVQMHYLARNFAAKLREEVIQQDTVEIFGVILKYKKIFFGQDCRNRGVCHHRRVLRGCFCEAHQ